MNYSITNKNIDECLVEINCWIEAKKKQKYFVCANPHSLEVARKDSEFDLSLKNADMIVPDGTGIIIASKILRGNIKERITGTDIFLGLSEILDKKRKI